MGIAAGTVKSTVSRGLERLRAAIDQQGGARG